MLADDLTFIFYYNRSCGIFPVHIPFFYRCEFNFPTSFAPLQLNDSNAKFDNALKDYTDLKERVVDFDPDELMGNRLAIRPGKERSAVSRMQSAYGNKYQPLMMYDSKQSISDVLGEKAEMQFIRDRQYQKTQAKKREVSGQKHQRTKENDRDR